MQSDLSAFDIGKATKEPSNYLVIGKRHSGKTTVIIDIISHLKPQPENRMLFIGNELDQKKYRDFFEKSEIYDTFPDGVDDNEIGHLINRQKTRLRGGKGLVVFDDALLTHTDFKKPNLSTISMHGNNLGISSIIGAGFEGLPSNVRSNINYLFFFDNNNQREIENIYNKYVAGSATLQEFVHLVEKFCQNYSCLVLDLTIATNDVSEYIFYYKAKTV